MSNSDTLDSFDQKILDMVQRNGRASIADIAEEVGLSKTPTLNRLRRLEANGTIKRYKAVIDPEKIHQSYITFVQVKLEATTRAHLDTFCRAVQDVPQIQSCHMMSGGYDFLLKVRTRNMRTYRAFLGDVLAELPGIAQTSTFPVMETVKDTDQMVIIPSGEG